MKRFLLDASVVTPLLFDYGEKVLDIASEVSLYLMDLTIYEVGNSLWKLAFLLKMISLKDAVEVVEVLESLVKKRFIEIVYFNELSLPKLVKLAVAEGLTFYDSSYIAAAEKLNSVLVTEDRELREEAKKYVKTMSYEQLRREVNRVTSETPSRSKPEA